MNPLAPPDAAMHWRSRTDANDQFLLYAFAAHDDSPATLMGQVRRRAAGIAELQLRIDPVPGDLDYPRWTTAPLADDQFRRHHVDTWTACLQTVAELMAAGPGRPTGEPGLTTSERREADRLWLIHLFGPLTGVPETDGPAHVLVLQIAHALGDGRRVSQLARRLLTDGPAARAPTRPDTGAPGRTSTGIPSLRAARGVLTTGPRLAAGLAFGLLAWRESAREQADHAAGAGGPPAAGPIAPTTFNLPDAGPVELRTVILDRARLCQAGTPIRSTVTVAVLTRLAEVLSAFGGASPDGRVIAEVTLARAPTAGQRNNFFTAGIDLRADLDRPARAEAIAAALDAARRRDDRPGRRDERRAAAWTPAVLASWAVRLSAAAQVPAEVAGATVVSSVNRGAADLRLGEGRVLFTAGFPALSRVHGLTHGVHGIGDTVTVSLAARGSAARTIDDYAAAVRSAFEGS